MIFKRLSNFLYIFYILTNIGSRFLYIFSILSTNVDFTNTSIGIGVFVIMTTPCKCSFYKCRGRLVSRKTLYNHSKKDLEVINLNNRESIATTMKSPSLSRCSFPESAYKTHHAATTQLYEKSSLSLLDYIFLEMRKFVSHPSFSKETVSENLRTDGEFKLPKPNMCPKTFYAARDVIKDFLIPLETYHVCPNDCVVFRGDLKDSNECPKCGAGRWKSGKKIPKKVFKYFPLAPRIARIYQTTSLAALMQEHGKRGERDELQDIWDCERWENDWFGINGEFKGMSLS